MQKLFTLLLALSFVAMISAKGIDKKVKPQTTGGGHHTEDVLDDSFLLDEGFEAGNFSGFTHLDETATPAMWHIDTWEAYGGSGESWWMGDPALGNANGGYNNSWYQVLDTDEIVLSGSGLNLTFYQRYSVEAPGNEPTGYDGWDGFNCRITTDGGLTWNVLTNPTPAYGATSAYSFGFEHNEGTGIPAWVGTQSTWEMVTFDLSAYADKTVKIRFAFASDPSYSTPDNGSMFGWQIDDIVVANSGGAIFENNGSATGFTPSSNVVAGGDLWSIVSATGLGGPNSGAYFASCNNSSNTYVPNMTNSLTSPWVLLPSVITEAYVDFSVRGSFLDNDAFPAVEFFGYYIQVKGENFRRYASNITQDPNGSNFVYSDSPVEWAKFSETYSTGLVDLSTLVGEEVRVIIEFESDEDTPIGEGLQVDDVQLWTPNTVPVEFTTFSAAQVGSQVKLEWATATELNNKGFEIERKVADSDWRVVGFVEGHGTMIEPTNYTFTDNISGIPAANISYRLKQIDYNGQFDYSDEIEIADLTPTEYAIDQNFPNPFNPSTTINFAIPADNYVSLKVYNMLGQEVATLFEGNLNAGNHQYTFDASNLSSGMYLYVINAGATEGQSEFTSVNKMMLMK